ncbi:MULTISPECIES: DUF4019 domain-containing protein [Burkholderia]|uniref:DUF4019 domain-containing protein n=1 Tax=Burkholderia TaxID=32008 RepID=UPI000327EFB7|nr:MULTISPECIES: DUF4019 domain-containing protein [Burkholderia]AGK49952.1 hypothetical protein BTI_3935 [Burkholderia thailandensis MSMB121]ATF32467.1 DUF4019 domain-containing protein [Burkholderia thailandensis]KST70559.1 hypothetical protein WS76_18055 [Burkholderia humptydooensis]KVN11758.1 hypothetical protein WT08_12465 [Burkholderia sp. MSMB1552]KWZ50654.1 hypothetical protein WS92_25130 [Burkholderia sp. MSMB1588]
MKKIVARCAAAGALLAAGALAHAQTSPSPDGVLQSAENVLKQIDEGRFDDVWKDCAAFVRSKSTAQRFADDTRRLRAPLGAVARRGWSDIMLIQFANTKDVPDGLYANVDFTTTLQGGKVVFEKLSLRRESDGQWRLVSYAPRQQQGVAPALAGQ